MIGDRPPVGTLEITLAEKPKPGAIFLRGQYLPREFWHDLWAWAYTWDVFSVDECGLTLPDMRFRIVGDPDGKHGDWMIWT